jgi:hypothetical protein
MDFRVVNSGLSAVNIFVFFGISFELFDLIDRDIGLFGGHFASFCPVFWPDSLEN